MSYPPPPPSNTENISPLPQSGLPIPMKDKPLWVFILLGLIIFIYLLEIGLPRVINNLLPSLPEQYQLLAMTGRFDAHSFVLVLLGANFRPFIIEGEVWRFFTAMFLHVNLTHLLFNAFALIAFGGETERLLGSARFIAIYLVSGLYGSLASFWLGEAMISAGASGAIFGVIGLQAAYFLRHRNTLGEFGRSRLTGIGFIILVNIFFGLSVPNIDNWAHMGGLVAGFGLGFAMAPIYRLDNSQFYNPQLIDASSPRLHSLILGGSVILLIILTSTALTMVG